MQNLPHALILTWPAQCPAAPGAAGLLQRVLPALWAGSRQEVNRGVPSRLIPV